MDPLSALSLAGNIVQFVDFGRKLLSDSKQLYRSSTGSLETHVQLELVTSDLQALISRLRQPKILTNSAAPLPKQQTHKSLEDLCDEAEKVARELITRLDNLKPKDGKPCKWESLQLAVKNAWKEEELNRLKNRLSEFRAVLETRMVFSIRESIDAQALYMSDRFDGLDKQTQIIISSLLGRDNRLTNVSSDIQAQLSSQTLALTQLVSRLSTINYCNHQNTRETIIRNLCGGEVRVTTGIEMLSVSDAQESQLRHNVHMQIISGLKYASMRTRYEDVIEAHPNTFEWTFNDPTPEQLPWSNFSSWLKSGDGVYWINGKAGSGKSTLMKQVYDDDRTRDYLKIYASEKPLCIATFFFWNSGSKDQRSQIGLLRSLLFQVLNQTPELASIIMPQIWAKAYTGCVDGQRMSNSGLDSWSLRQLMTSFKAFVNQEEIPLKTCFFIDGLDEFEGDHGDIASLFKEIAESRNVKVCLSSRPLVVFGEAFQSCPSLRLQDFTFADIKCFVSEKFYQTESFRRIAEQEPAKALSLINETVQRADGVFLWVQIVVRSLLAGIRNRDSLPELLGRLHDLPREIEPLYQHILDLIEPLYLQWASKAFQIVRLAHRLADSAGILPLTVRRFYYAMNFDAAKVTLDRATPADLSRAYEDLEIQLTARCGGLLETAHHKHREDARIKWFHRTARDFIEKNSYGSNILDSSLRTDFIPNVWMMRSTTLELFSAFSTGQHVQKETINTLLQTCLIYAQDADTSTESHRAQVDILDQVDRFLATRWQGRQHWMVPFIASNRSIPALDITFLHVATLYDLTGYVRAKVPKETLLQYNPAKSLLRFRTFGNDSSASARMISLLDELGANMKPEPRRRGFLKRRNK